MISEISKLLEETRQYTKEHSELQLAHHFLFALFDAKLIQKSGDTRYLIMGINPGEHSQDWECAPCPPVHEESFEIDFHEQYRNGRDAVKWTRTIENFCDTKKYMQSEMFFWSSNNVNELEQRYGPVLNNKHLAFCNRLNRELINLTSPDAIIVPGIGSSKIMSANYDLTFVETVKDPENEHKLCERYTDENRTWLFTKHWSGAFGFSKNQVVSDKPCK